MTTPLTDLDASFLHLQDAHVALHLGATAVFDGSPPPITALRSRYASVATRDPRYRQRLHRSPLDLRRPAWTDGEVDLDYHVRRAALPSPGGPEELERLIGRIMTYRLDPARPLWEAWLVEGLADDRWALVLKVHHSVVDGVGGMALFGSLLDDGADTRPAPDSRAPVRLPSPLALVRGVTRMVGDLAGAVAALRPTASTSLVGPLNEPRRYRTLAADLADVRTVRDVFGGSVGEVLLTMVTRGFHGLLLCRDEAPAPHSVRCTIPVSVHRAERPDAARRVEVMRVDLPVEFGDVESAFASLRMRVEGDSRASHGDATTVVTNVPGPRRQQALFGRPMVALYPYVPIGERMRIGVAATTYGDRLHLGVTCDRISVPDADLFVTAMATGLTELVKSAGARPRH